MNKESKQHTIGRILLSVTAILWGAGFVLNDQLQNNVFVNSPALLNAARFVGAALALLVIFNKKLKFNKINIIYGCIGGAMLFAGFQLQLMGLSQSTPAHCGFFTAAYIIFVPFITWILYKKRPSWVVFCGIGVAVVGLFIINLDVVKPDANGANTLVGDLLTLSGALLFAAQIVMSDHALKRDVDYKNLTFWQVVFASVLFVLYSLIFESKNYASINLNLGYSWWRLLIVVFGGTAFAYFAQSYAQRRVAPSETSLILACESPIGAIISIAVGHDVFSWTIVVGGLLVVIAVVLVELIPELLAKRQASDK